MKEEILLSIKGVSFHYGSIEVLRDINLEIRRGEMVGIIGPNGAGKSTLLRIVAGYLTPAAGHIELFGTQLKNYDRRALARHIATLPQTIDIPFPYTVEEFIIMGRYPYNSGNFSYRNQDRQVVREIMEVMNIAHLGGRHMGALSEGERQKVFLAQSIVQSPDVLLLDEPVSHLDIKHQLRTLETLDNLHRDGLTILMVLHDLNLASEFCSHIVLISQGRIYASGPPETTLTYDNIEKVYDTVVVVRENPLSKKPFIVPVPRKYLAGDEKKQPTRKEEQ